MAKLVKSATAKEEFFNHPYLACTQVSKSGLVRSSVTKKPYKTSFTAKGYCRVVRRVNGISKTFLIHRLVAETFIPNPEKKRTVNHINGNKSDNTVKNLEWCSYSENNKHAHDLGLNHVSTLNRKRTSKRIKAAWVLFRIRKLIGQNPECRKAFSDYQSFISKNQNSAGVIGDHYIDLKLGIHKRMDKTLLESAA